MAAIRVKDDVTVTLEVRRREKGEISTDTSYTRKITWGDSRATSRILDQGAG